MKIQYMSDLHIEHFSSFSDFNFQYKEKYGNYICDQVSGQVLILAGDIGNPMFGSGYFDFLKYCSPKYCAVIVVAGNHEFYGNEYWSTVEKMKSLASQFENVHFLYQNSVEISVGDEQVVFLGCTLWSEVPVGAVEVVQNSLNDYKLISIMENGISRKLNVQDTVGFFNEDLIWLSNELTKNKDKKVVVCSHHAPLLKSVGSPQYENTTNPRIQLYNHAFASDLSNIIQSPIQVWIYGHTHYSITTRTNSGVIVAGNQLGYLSSKYTQLEGNTFNAATFVEI